jgi:hypothetical protein
MKIFDAEKITTHGGSLRVYVSKNLNIKEEKTIQAILDEEIRDGINNYKVFQEFELSNCIVCRASSLLTFESTDAHSYVRSGDHVDIVGSITYSKSDS